MKKNIMVSDFFTATSCAYGQSCRPLQPFFENVNTTDSIIINEAYRANDNTPTILYLYKTTIYISLL